MAIPFALIGRAQSYGITVRLDETTSGDLDVIATSIGNTSVGAEVQRSVRRLATSAAGEMALLANQRFANGTLTLDDGSAAPLAAGDQITVVREGEALGTYVNAHGATMQAPVKRVILIPDPDSSTMKPYAILILANNTCRRVLVHPSATCRALRNVTAGDWSIADRRIFSRSLGARCIL